MIVDKIKEYLRMKYGDAMAYSFNMTASECGYNKELYDYFFVPGNKGFNETMSHSLI